MDKKYILGGILKFKKPIIILVFIMVFFSFYNIFLVDHALEDLRFSLEQTALAYSVEDADGVDMVITKSMSEEMPYAKINTRDIANLEYAKKVIVKGKDFRQLDSAKVALTSVIAQKEKKRGWFLSLLDKIFRPIRKNVGKLAHIYSIIVKPPKLTIASPAEQVELIESISTLEKEQDLNKAVAGLKELIKKYPNNEKTPLIKLRLANLYQKLGRATEAMKGYREIIGDYPVLKEAQIARSLLSGLMARDTIIKSIDYLIIQYNTLSKARADERQQIAYDIGRNYTKLLNLNEAIKFFTRAYNLNPSSDIAIKSQLAISWLYRQKNNFKESEKTLGRIIGENPETGLINDVYYQIASTYYYQGKYEQSVELLKKLVETYRKENPELASLYLFQVGASYMYDLNDPEKAEEIFKQLTKEFPDSPYQRYISPKTPAGVFLTYLVPRATRVVTWRMMGLVCISGYVGELCKFKAVTKESAFNIGFNDWLRKELPDTVGNLYVEIKGQKTEFGKDKLSTEGMITMGNFKVEGKASWTLVISKAKMLNMRVIKAFLEKLPLPPMLLNRSLTGMERIVEKNTPVEITNVSIDRDAVVVEGVGSKAVVERLKKATASLFGTEFDIADIKDTTETESIYTAFIEKFPEADFASVLKNDDGSLFLDFFIRMSMFVTFRILETVKDSKFDYERSIRAWGQLMVKRERFMIDLKKDDVVAELSRYIRYEFPWVVGDNFLVDVQGMELDFKDNGDIDFDINANLGYGEIIGGSLPKPNIIKAKGVMRFEIDKELGIPKWVFKEMALNGRSYPVEKLNLVTTRCFNILRDDRVPLALEEIRPYNGGIIFKGSGARDFTARLFNDPHLFVIFQIRDADLDIAGIKKLREFERADEKGAYYRSGLQKTYKPEDLIPAAKSYVR